MNLNIFALNHRITQIENNLINRLLKWKFSNQYIKNVNTYIQFLNITWNMILLNNDN